MSQETFQEMKIFYPKKIEKLKMRNKESEREAKHLNSDNQELKEIT